jgi:transcriptional regulator with XRE-family HTH domain
LGVPKKSGLMSDAEAKIGARIKEFRERIEWPQSGFAYEVGITRNKLASIEYGWTPLRYALALRMCQRFNLSRLWLAKGTGSPQTNWEVDKKIEASIPDKMLFSEAFSRFIEPAISPILLNQLKVWDKPGHVLLTLPPTGIPQGRQHEWYAVKAFREAVERIPENKRTAFCDAVLSAIGRLFATHTGVELPSSRRTSAGQIRRLEKFLPQGASAGAEMDLTDTAGSTKIVATMKVQMPSLLERLKKVTAAPGKKTELAAALNPPVPLESVSRWLSGSREPSGEVTLQLLRWVELQERQAK